jgi:hypothetical protein
MELPQRNERIKLIIYLNWLCGYSVISAVKNLYERFRFYRSGRLKAISRIQHSAGIPMISVHFQSE